MSIQVEKLTKLFNKSELFEFKRQHSLEDRISETKRLKVRFPDRVPVIVECTSKTQPINLTKKKCLVPGDVTVSQFLYILRKYVRLNSEKAIFLFVENEMPASGLLMADVYNKYGKGELLYFSISTESTFGTSG
jgi:GABA(A) receptor-associated protein